jgi:stalled ribosome rescue protein Dom34
MSTNVGIWLDRSNAIIIRMDDKKSDTITLSSDIETARHPRCGTEGHCTIIPERRLRQRRKEIVRKYYKKIIETIRNAGSILILGPGIAKNEFLNEIGAVKQLRARMISIETADKMSPRQLESRVRKFYDDLVYRSPMRDSMLCAFKR